MPPIRRSLPDEQILHLGEGQDAGSRIEQLQEQLLLRQHDTREFGLWEQAMAEIGTPDALAEVQRKRREFTDILPANTASSAAQEPASVQEATSDARPSPFAPPSLIAQGSAAPAAPSPPTGPSVVDSVPPFSSEKLSPPIRPTNADVAEVRVIEPMPITVGDGVPVETDSISVVKPRYDEELDDDVDDTDRIPLDFNAGITPTLPPPSISPPSGPIATVRVPEDEVVLIGSEAISQPVFRPERAGGEPTPLDHRVGRATRLFWIWFAPSTSIMSLSLGAIIFSLGMSLLQSIISVLIGIALSFVPLGMTALLGTRSGQPTMVVSRASFGYWGNVIPAIVALMGRVFWGGALLWFLALSIIAVLVTTGSTGSLNKTLLMGITLVILFLLVVVIAFFGYSMIARLQLSFGILAAILVIGFIALTFTEVDFSAAVRMSEGSWLLVVTGAVLVFSFVGLMWAHSGSDLARYQRPDSSGGGAMAWATTGAALPSAVLIGYGILLSASDASTARGLIADPFDSLADALPAWYTIPLIVTVGLSLFSSVIVTLYSGVFAFQSLGFRLSRQWSVAPVAVLLGLTAFAFSTRETVIDVFQDSATTLAVPTAAWVGILFAETMIRNRRFSSRSLLERGGIYGSFRVANVIGLIVLSAIGFGFTTATIPWLRWQGYLFDALGVPLDSALARTDLGVFAALFLGILLPVASGIPAIRRQEEARLS